MSRILLLAGTGEARRLAGALAKDHDVIASLAGATAAPAAYPCLIRTGGFGGAAGLAAYLCAERVEALVDATHPFAATISANAVEAAVAAGVPLVRLARPPWTRRSGETWIDAPDLETAAAALPAGARAFLATGRSSLAAFHGRTDRHLFLRVVDPPEAPFPGAGAYVVARPPFGEDAERALFARLGVTHLVAKNAGGADGRAKVDAAASMGLPIVMVRRPAEPNAAPRLDAAEISLWLARLDRFA